MNKICKKCEHTKSFENFSNKDGSNYCKNCEKIRNKEYYQSHKETIKQWMVKYRKTPASKEKTNENRRLRYKNEPHFKIRHNLKNRVLSVLKGNCKSNNTLCLLGCSLSQFQSHLISKFSPQMSWKHFMEGKIHIDHIIPCINFDLTKPQEQKKCFNYKNIQPLWETTKIARENGDLINRF